MLTQPPHNTDHMLCLLLPFHTPQDILEEGLTVSGQGLVYNFESAQYGSYKVSRQTAPCDNALQAHQLHLS